MKTSRLTWLFVGTIGMLLCVACGSAQLSSNDRIATRVAEDQSVASTLTAIARAAPSAVIPDSTSTPISEQAATPVADGSDAPTPPVDTPTIARPTYEDVPPATAKPNLPEPTTAPTEAPDPDRVAYEDSKPDGNIIPGSPIQDNEGNVIDNITIEGGISIADAQGEQDGLVLVRNRLAVRVDAWLNGAGYTRDTNPGIANVDISIVRSSDGQEVYQKTENNPPYCSFSDDSNGCILWVFGDHDNQWPTGQAIEDGEYKVNVTIHLTAYEQTQPFWFASFYIERS